MNNFRVVLYQTAEQQVYRPGQTISGAVEFTLTEPKSYECIKVDFFGKAHVEWSRGKTRYLGNEKYVEDSIILWSPQQGGKLGPGSFSFRFQFHIPPLIPSSFNHTNTTFLDNGSGYVSYEVVGRAVTGLFRFDHTSSAPIPIAQIIDINVGNLVTPVQQVKRKQIGCLCCVAGDVEFVVKIPRTGYCSTNDDTIPLSVDVQNNSTRVIHMKAQIIKKVTLFVRSYENTSTDTVAEISSNPINPGGSTIWNPTQFIVPRLPPTLIGCRIIHVDYTLKVSAVIPNSIDLSCKIPLIFGNVPYVMSSGDRPIVADPIVAALIQGTLGPRLSAHAVQTHPRNIQSNVRATSATVDDDFDDRYNIDESKPLI